MSAASAPQPDISHVYQIDAERRFEIQPSSPTHLQSFIAEMDGEAWLWCFRCERAFQLGEARSTGFGLGCAYPNCGGEALDFWSWDAFRAFVGDVSLAPDYAVRYPLAA